MVAYESLLKNSRVWWWMVATVGTRLAVCTISLGVVFAAKSATGSYAWGAVIADAYAGGEAIGAPMGARFQRRPLRKELAWVALTEAIALVGVVVTLSLGAPLAAAVLAALAGGVASGTFGGLRTLVVGLVPESRENTLALDVIMNQLCQIAGPALAASAAVAWSPDAPLLIVCGGLVVVAAVTVKLPESVMGAADSGNTVQPEPRRTSTLAVVRVIGPSLAVSTVVLTLHAVLEVTPPSVLGQRHGPPAWAGIALSGLAVTSVAGSFLYGLRRWFGRPHTHTLIFAGGFSLMVTVVGVVWSPVVTVVLVAACGLFQAAASTARSLTVTDVLPADDWSVGFSLLYSFGAVGFTGASAVSALFLAAGSAEVLLIVFGPVGIVIFALTWWWERTTEAREANQATVL
ncbi:hypothetical protein RKE29_14645 [Streptomyces sp. B1866]|uniref:hypothetical protein n=1 Tax=Streptomyces sp. B1866 TaxID=3075431 RepID=UPI0028905B6D|nr:hypothetical protein [Streptomyces sp. B1866]MDT3397867.1 hypothetical protein [Streptomyces sp. B1866]